MVSKEHIFDVFIRSKRSDNTRKAYRKVVGYFAKFIGCSEPREAVDLLLEHGYQEAVALVTNYKRSLLTLGKAPRTVNTRISALRSFITFARDNNVIEWVLPVRDVKLDATKDNSGPSYQEICTLLRAAREQGGDLALRDVAIIRLTVDAMLRRAEIVSLDVCHLDKEQQSLSVLRKGAEERTTVRLPPLAWAAVNAWVAVRGPQPGPLFFNLDRARHAHSSRRLTTRGVARIFSRLRQDVSITSTGLRHSAITRALELSGGDYSRVMRLSGHRKYESVKIYDDRDVPDATDVADLQDQLSDAAYE